MSHELTIRENGKVEMAYAGETPWHGLGEQMAAGATIEEWLTAAGMDWRILRSRVRYAVARDTAADQSTWRTMDDRCVLLRSDNGNGLGIVSDGYKPVQPAETLEFFRDLTGAAGFTIETAGTLFGGRKFWCLARTNAEAVIADQRDKVRAYLMLATSCDGSMATEGKYVAIRVVCNNTLTLGRGERTGALKVKVNHRTAFDPKSVKADLGIEAAQSAFDRTVAAMAKMAETRMSEEAMILATAGLFHPGYIELDADRKAKILRTKPVEPIARLALDGGAIGDDMTGVRGTAWGWLNAVTQYIDHSAVTKGDTKTDNRLDSAWFGRGEAVKVRAYEMAGAAAEAGSNGAVASVNRWLSSHGGSGALLDAAIDATNQGK